MKQSRPRQTRRNVLREPSLAGPNKRPLSDAEAGTPLPPLLGGFEGRILVQAGQTHLRRIRCPKNGTFFNARADGDATLLQTPPWGSGLLRHRAAIILGGGICLKAMHMTDVTQIRYQIEGGDGWAAEKQLPGVCRSGRIRCVGRTFVQLAEPDTAIAQVFAKRDDKVGDTTHG